MSIRVNVRQSSSGDHKAEITDDGAYFPNTLAQGRGDTPEAAILAAQLDYQQKEDDRK